MKTFTAIAASYAFNLYPAIITAPKSTLDGWKKSIITLFDGKIKPEEVKIISEYNPKRDNVKWQFLICNYERLQQALEYSVFAAKKPELICVDQ